jgi:hypothetical protein
MNRAPLTEVTEAQLGIRVGLVDPKVTGQENGFEFFWVSSLRQGVEIPSSIERHQDLERSMSP